MNFLCRFRAVGEASTPTPGTMRAPGTFSGLDNPWKRSPEYEESQKALDAYQREQEAANKAAEESGDISTMSRGMRQAGQSLGFSGGAMAASLAGGSAAGTAGRYIGGLAGPEGAVAGELAGRGVGALGASYGAAYRMAGAQFLDDARKEIDAKFLQVTGRPPNEQEQEEAYQELLPLAQAFGHAEAGPETIGNLAMAGAGKYVFGLGKKTVERLAAGALKKTGAAAGGVATELGGETATAVEQARIETDKAALMQGQEPAAQAPRTVEDYVKAFKEVAPATLATMGLMSAAPAAAKAASVLKDTLVPQSDTAPDGTPAPVDIQTPVEVNGTTIAYIPQGSDLTPDDVAGFAEEPDQLKMMARNGLITLPEIVPPLPGVDRAITTEMNENIAAGAALAPQTVATLEALSAEQPVAEVSTEPGEFAPTPVKDPGETDNSISEPKAEQVSPVTTPATEIPADAANVSGDSQSVQTEPAEGSIPAVTADTVPVQAETSTAEIQPDTPVGDVEWSPQINEPVSFIAPNGQKIVGTLQSVTDSKATISYPWNGKTLTAVVPAAQLSRPVSSLTDPPSYQYTQEQNTRKAGKHFPTTPGVHENFDFRTAFTSMAADTSLSRFYRDIARVLSTKPEFADVDFHVVADGRKRYAGEYSHHQGRSAIAVNLRQVARGQVDALGTILHEALHHETLAKVRKPEAGVETEAAQALDQIRQRVRSYAAVQEKAKKFAYELGSNEEFISAVFTRPDFQEFLASIPDDFSPNSGAGRFRSLLSEIFRLIAQLVTGKHVAKGSSMEQAMTTILALFETPHRTVETGPLGSLNAAESKPGYRSPVSALEQTAAKLRGDQAVEKPAGLDSMFNPKEGRPVTGERKLFELPKTDVGIPTTENQPIDITTAYQKAQSGKSSGWVSIKDVFDQAKQADPSLTPEAFMAHVNEQNDTGEIFISPVENLATVEAAQPFVVGAAGAEMLVPQEGTAASLAEEPQFAFTRARFAPPKPEDQIYQVQGDKEANKKALDWINAVGPIRAADLLMSGRTPGWMDLNVKNIVMGGLLKGFTDVSLDPNATEDEKTVARATNQRLGKFRVKMNQDPARGMRQIGVQNGTVLQPIAPILAAEQVLADRGEKILEKQMDGGSEGAAPRVAKAADDATTEADERLENIISRLMGSMSPKQTAVGALAKMFRGKGQRDQLIEEVAKALMLKSRGNVVTPERKTALANLASSLKSTLGASVKGEKIPAPERTMQDLLTSAFVNQVSEAPAFKEAWDAGRQKVLDMLIDMELDKSYHPAEERLRGLRARLQHLEAGSVEQQKASAVERAQLATQIDDTKAEMKAEMDAVKAMTPQLEAQRDKLMPSAPTVAFDPVASREAIGRAFEQAGYTAEMATGLDKSGKRALSIKDALLNRKRATDVVMKQFDDAMAAKDAATQRDWPQARPLAEKAVKETLNEWQKQIDADKAAKLEATKKGLLGEDSKALEKLVNSIRAKIAPDADWSDILQDLPRVQAERLAAVKDRVAKHEALKNLTPDEATKLAENIDKLWQRERLKAFQDELLKAGVLKAKTTKAAVNVAAAAPELLRLMNLGVFNSGTFREAVAQKFGLKMMTNAQADHLRRIAAAAWDQPQGVLRNKKLKELVEGLQHVTGGNWSDAMNSYWTASVLSSLRTHFDTWMAVINGLGTNLIQSGTQLAKGNGAAAVAAQAQWWKSLFAGMNEAAHILWTGDPSFTKRFEADLIKALDGEKGVHPIAIGEKLWKEGTALQKIPGALMMLVGRSMMAADHVNNTATTQGAMAVARALNPELYEGKTSWTQKEISDARKQAIAETTGGLDPANREEQLTVSARTREILNAGLKAEDRLQASEVGDMAAFQNDPTGLFGGLYHAVKAGLSSAVRGLDETAQNEEATKIARALAAAAAGSVHALTGTRFMRFGFNLGNEFMRYMPGSWLLNKAAPILGTNLSPMQQELLLGKNLVGAVLLGSLYSLFGDDDGDEDGKWHMEGPWNDLSQQDKDARMSAGINKSTFWKRENGEIRRISYSQWPTAGLLAAVGSMLDEKRYKPEVWKERGVAGHMLRGTITGLFQVQNASAMQQLAELFSSSAAHSGQDKAQGLPDKIIKMGTNYAGGLVPTVVKDLDKWEDPRNFRADGVWERLMREMPLARRFVNDGRPQFNRIGQDVRVHREPYSRLYTADQANKATTAYGHLLARGLDFPNPSTDRKIIKDGKKVPMETLGKGVTYDFEKAVAVGYGKYLEEYGEQLMKMPTKVADKVLNTRAKRIIEIEAAKVQARVNNP